MQIDAPSTGQHFLLRKSSLPFAGLLPFFPIPRGQNHIAVWSITYSILALKCGIIAYCIRIYATSLTFKFQFETVEVRRELRLVTLVKKPVRFLAGHRLTIQPETHGCRSGPFHYPVRDQLGRKVIIRGGRCHCGSVQGHIALGKRITRYRKRQENRQKEFFSHQLRACFEMVDEFYYMS